jgi:SNF2 family DNA or RNA helicase
MSGWRDEIRTYINATISNQLTEVSPRADQPTWIRQPLRPHQQTLLSAARRVERLAHLDVVDLQSPRLVTSYGVLADRVGAGKSLVALSLIRDDPVQRSHIQMKESGGACIVGARNFGPVQPFKPEWSTLTDVEMMSAIFSDRRSQFYTRTALVIVPHNVVTQWEEYIQTQTTLRAYVIKRTKDWDQDLAGLYRSLFQSDLVLVSNTMLTKFIRHFTMQPYGSAFYRIVWSRVFIDEADSIACSLKPHEISARFFWFITGSWLNMLFPDGLNGYTFSALPDDVRGLLGDGGIPGIVSSHNVVSHTLSRTHHPQFTDLIVRNADAWIETSLARPVIVHESILCKMPANIGLLESFLSGAALEALHAGDTAGAMSAMGLKAKSKESLVECVTASLRSELAQAERELAFKQGSTYSSASAKRAGIERAETRVADIRSRLTSLEARVAAAATDAHCPICYDSPRCTTLTPCCRNAFCLECICECVKAKPECPMCRAPIRNVRDLLVMGEEEEEVAEEVGETDVTELPAKSAALLKLLSDSTTDQRFLVFSAHEASFKGLRDMLDARGIRCELLQGTVARVERIRKQFREGTIRVLCMNARHVGAGLNLEAATHIVLYHRMNVELERQVIGRAVRFERAAELRVVHLVHEEETAANGLQNAEVIMHV